MNSLEIILFALVFSAPGYFLALLTWLEHRPRKKPAPVSAEAIERVLRNEGARPNHCLLFPGNQERWGYGLVFTDAEGKLEGELQRKKEIKAGGAVRLADRLTYEMAYGPIPDGMIVRHRCGNMSCCNVSHLYLHDVSDLMVYHRSLGNDVSDFFQIKALLERGLTIDRICTEWLTDQDVVTKVFLKGTWRGRTLELHGIPELPSSSQSS